MVAVIITDNSSIPIIYSGAQIFIVGGLCLKPLPLFKRHNNEIFF